MWKVLLDLEVLLGAVKRRSFVVHSPTWPGGLD